MRVQDRGRLGSIYKGRGKLASLVDPELRASEIKMEIGAGEEGMGRTALFRKDRWAGVRGALGLSWLGEEFEDSFMVDESLLVVVEI